MHMQNIQTVITFYLGPAHSVKNLRKVRVECTGGEGEEDDTGICTIWTENLSEHLDQKCAKRLKVYTEHVAN